MVGGQSIDRDDTGSSHIMQQYKGGVVVGTV